MSKDETLPIGRITAAHGIKGEVKLAPYGDLSGLHWKTVYAVGKGQTLKCTVKSVRPNRNELLVGFREYQTRDEAQDLVGLEVFVNASDLPELPQDEYYYYELIGTEVYSEENRYLGKVEGIMSTGSNDVLEVKGPQGEVLIPAIEDVILEVDLRNKRITVRLMNGLLPEDE